MSQTTTNSPYRWRAVDLEAIRIALSIPAHKPMRVGTLRQILKDVASQSGVSLEEVVQAIGG